jgi:hypothetical protein
MSFDDVSVTAVTVLYSRKNGNWNDKDGANGTWSTTGFTGLASGLVPGNGQLAIIGGGFTVDLTADTTVGGVDVRNTGVLRYTVPSLDLGIEAGLVYVRSGGTINRNGQTDAQIDFNQAVGGATLTVESGGVVTIDDITYTANGTNLYYLAGGGSLTISDDILIGADNATIVNNMTTSIGLDQITFSAGTQRADFQNNGTISATSVFYDDDSNVFTNTGTLTLSSIIVNNATDDNSAFTNSGTLTLTGAVSINTNGGDFFINNSGTINQEGNFANLVSGSDFTNQTNGIWNWTFVTATLPPNFGVAMICSANNNIFNYAATGNQPIGAITYHHLGVSGSGTKTLTGGVTANGNLSISGTATLDPFNNALTIGGTTTISGGTFNDSHAAGLNTFVGNVGVGAAGTFNSTGTSHPNMVFRGGIDNAGTFTAGGATFDTNIQSISGAGNISFGFNVAINSITVTNSNTGSFTVSGTTTLTSGGFIDNDNTSITTFAGNVSQSGTSVFNTTGVFTSGNLVFQGGISNNGGSFTAGGALFNTNAQAIGGNAPLSFANFVIVTGVTVTNNNTASISLTRLPGGVTLAGTGTWTQGANSTLNYTGTSIGINTFNASNAGNTVNYNSATSVQTIRVPNSTYANLTLNNSSASAPQLTLGGNVVVTGALTLTDGVVSTSGSALLTLNDNATSTVGSANSYVDGPIRKIGDDAFIFPTGNGTVWARIGISAPTTATTQFTAQYFDANYGNESTDGTFNDESDVEYWTLDRAVTADGVQVTLFWENNTRSKINSPTADLIVARYTGTLWTSEGQSAIASSGATGSVTSNMITTFSPITFGSLSVALNPLPIELVNFTATPFENSVHLNWTTASELNNDYFTVERSVDGESFSVIGDKIKGAGTTNQARSYNLVDQNPLNGTAYYRLKQTDFDGTFSFSKIISVTYDGPVFPVMNLYPNPTKGNFITIKIEGLKNMETVPVVIYDQVGKAWMSKVLSVDQNTQSASDDLVFDKKLPKGMYLVKAGLSQIQVGKFVVYEN